MASVSGFSQWINVTGLVCLAFGFMLRAQDEGPASLPSLLVDAGADVNARDEDRNTPLHETFLTDVEEELLMLGADVNARNKEGETPIFTTVDDAAIPLFLAHGADLNIRNNEGLTVLDAAKDKGRLGRKLFARRFRRCHHRSSSNRNSHSRS